jgi:hypothetical protein
MKLPPHLVVVDVSVDPAVEAEWNAWYNAVHLPDIVTCPGFRRAARYVSEADGKRHYLTVYEVDGPVTIESVEFGQRRGWGKFKDKVQSKMRTYERLTALEPADVERKR